MTRVEYDQDESRFHRRDIVAKRKTKKTTRKEWVEPSVLDRLRTIGAWFGGIFLTILGIWGSAHVREQVTTDPRYSLESWQLDLVELPRWVTPQIRAELESLVDFAPEAGAPEAGAPEVPTLFDRGVLRRVQEQLESSPWVERLVDVKLSYPDTSRPGAVHVELEVLRPVAETSRERSHGVLGLHAGSATVAKQAGPGSIKQAHVITWWS